MSSAIQRLQQLRAARAQFGGDAERQKQQLVAALATTRVNGFAQLAWLHEDLLFICAFPGDHRTRALARAALLGFSQRWRGAPKAARERASNSGIAGTVTRPSLAWPLARALVPVEAIEVDWAGMEDAAAFDALVARLVSDAERDAFHGGEYTTRGWITLACPPGERAAGWLVRQGRAAAPHSGFAAAWDAAQVPLRWSIADSPRSATHARLARGVVRLRRAFRRLDVPAAEHIARPLKEVRRLDPRAAARYIDLARSALVSRAREVHAINYPNPADVYLADLGEGVELAVIGVAAAERLMLEANYGYLLVSNGLPIGYGGVSPLHRQANTGINIFDPYRGSEAAYLWAQTLRAFRTLFGIGRFVINGYQFGAGNSEAIASGAYWFYYRLGFRPSVAENLDAAAVEADRLRRTPAVRTTPRVLRQLAQGDLHLDLADFRSDDFFEEALLGRVGAVVARRIAALPSRSHPDGEAQLSDSVRRALRLPGAAHWPAAGLRGFRRLAPCAALMDLPSWSADERRALAAWLRAKGEPSQRNFARLATQQLRFFRELRDMARREAGGLDV
jgi:hypothetical protein